ncbi:MAG TPA: efflux RND transporter periplasmic adaptor subunit [Devosiaceae bacterium]
MMARLRTRLWVVTLIGLSMAFPATGQQAKTGAVKPARLVRVVPVAAENYVDTATLTGEIRARSSVDLAFRLSGQIAQIAVSVGDHVAAGQVLARLDPETQKADLDLAEAGVAAAQAALDQARAAQDRQKSLFEAGLTTASRYDQAQADTAAAQGNLDGALAMRETARNALGYTELRAEADAIITRVDRQAGEIAQAAQPVLSVAIDGPRDAVFNAYESLLFADPEAIKTTKVQLALVSSPQITATGQVREISPTVDTRTGTVRVAVGIDRAPEAMTLGALVTGRVALAPVRAFVVPWTAITLDRGEPAVWLMDRQNRTAFLRHVGIARYATDSVVVDKGLEPGDLLVAEGGQFLYEGCPVLDVAETRP